MTGSIGSRNWFRDNQADVTAKYLEHAKLLAALESIAEDRAVYATELQNIARRALGLEVLS